MACRWRRRCPPGDPPLPPTDACLCPRPGRLEQQKQQTLHTLPTILLRIAAQQPVLFVMEDLHWVDPPHTGVSQLARRSRPHRPHPGAVDLSPGLQSALDGAGISAR